MPVKGTAVGWLLMMLTGTEPDWMASWRGEETEHWEEPRWVQHTVTPRETVQTIAARYGVKSKSVRHWNKLGRKRPRAGRVLKVRTRQMPPPKVQQTHTVVEGDTWGRLAANYNVSTKDLHGWNWKTRELEVGMELRLWTDPGFPWTVGRKLGPLPNHNLVPLGARSHGKPGKGRLKDGVRLPDSPDYTLRAGAASYGSSHAVRAMQTAFANFRYETGYEGEIVIGDFSRRRGGRFRPHKSHQSGRDVDIRFPRKPGVPKWGEPNRHEIDWMATWLLFKSLIDTGAVQSIYVTAELQRDLYEAARALGFTHEELAPLITYPRDGPKLRAIVRHEKGHDDHFHVRFTCGPDEPTCRK